MARADLLDARHRDAVLELVARALLRHLVVHFARAEQDALHVHRVLECGALVGDQALEARLAYEVVERAARVVVTQQRLGRHHHELCCQNAAIFREFTQVSCAQYGTSYE